MSLIGPSLPTSAPTVGIFNALIPAEGPKVIPYTVNFAASSSAVIDLTNAQQRKQITSIQTIFIDNSLSPTSTTIQSTNIGQKIIAPAYSQGYYPVLVSNPPVFSLNNTSAVNVGVYFLNIPINGAVWSSSGAGSIFSDPVLDATVLNNNIRTVPGAGALTSGSTVTTVATSTLLFAANASRTYLLIQAPIGATNTGVGIWVNFLGGTAGPNLADSVLIQPGQVYESGTKVTSSVINYYDPVGGLELVAYQG